MEMEAGVFDPLASAESGGARAEGGKKKAAAPLIEFFGPTELAAYVEPAGHVLLGDYVLQRGAMTLLLGAPGVGKSRAALWLAAKGAVGEGSWFGLPLRASFRSLVIQNENGMPRLARDFRALQLPAEARDSIRVCTPPPLGMQFGEVAFRAALKAEVLRFEPSLVILDPWNSVCLDSMERDFQEGLGHVREVLASVALPPALLVVHHLRKPRADDRARGRSLVNLGAGSYTLNSTARATLVLQAASDAVEDQRVVFNVAKANDSVSPWPARTAWRLHPEGFEAVVDFDWAAFDGEESREGKIRAEHIREVLRGGAWINLSDARRALEVAAGCGHSAAYDAFKPGSKFAELFERDKDGRSERVRARQEVAAALTPGAFR
jgi:hypothetical protein